MEPDQAYQTKLNAAIEKTGMKEASLCRLFVRQGLDRWEREGVLVIENQEVPA